MNSCAKEGLGVPVQPVIPALKKSLKIPMGQSESLNRRRTDSTNAKRKGTTGQITIYKTHI
jgi:hypothetical protein